MSRHEITTSTPTVGGRVRRVLGGGRVRAALSLGIVLGLGSVGTLAAWSDTATATSGEFRTATMNLEVGPSGTSSKNYTFSGLTSSGLLPGTTTEATLPLQNKGELALNYSMTANATGNAAVAGQITISVFAGTCSGNALASSALSTTSATASLIPTPRAITAGGTDTLCIRATAGNSLTKAMQNQSINVVFTLTATSV